MNLWTEVGCILSVDYKCRAYLGLSLLISLKQESSLTDSVYLHHVGLLVKGITLV